MTITVNYEKRKNTELFKNLEKLGFEKPQNYIPLYKNFFVLNDNNSGPDVSFLVPLGFKSSIHNNFDFSIRGWNRRQKNSRWRRHSYL